MTRIAIVDDSATARLFIRRCLEIIGFFEADFIEAENGKDALTKIREEQPDLLITDLNMPLMDGETLLKWLKTSPRFGNRGYSVRGEAEDSDPDTDPEEAEIFGGRMILLNRA